MYIYLSLKEKAYIHDDWETRQNNFSPGQIRSVDWRFCAPPGILFALRKCKQMKTVYIYVCFFFSLQLTVHVQTLCPRHADEPWVRRNSYILFIKFNIHFNLFGSCYIFRYFQQIKIVGYVWLEEPAQRINIKYIHIHYTIIIPTQLQFILLISFMYIPLVFFTLTVV